MTYLRNLPYLGILSMLMQQFQVQWSTKSLKLWHQHAQDAQIWKISKVSDDQIHYIKARFEQIFSEMTLFKNKIFGKSAQNLP